MPPKRTPLPTKSEGSSVNNDTSAVNGKRIVNSPSFPASKRATNNGPTDEYEEDGKKMTPADLQFLKDCLKFVVGGAVVVDIVAIAEARGQKNPRSVQNRLTQMRNRYGLPFRAFNGGSIAEGSAVGSSPVKPITLAKRKSTGRPPGPNSKRVSRAKIYNSGDAANSDSEIIDDLKEKERRAEASKLQFLQQKVSSQVMDAPPPSMSQTAQDKSDDIEEYVYEKFEARFEVDAKVEDDGGEEEFHAEAVSKGLRLRD